MLNRFEACVRKCLKMFQIGIHLPFTADRHGSVWKQRSLMRRPWKASKTSTVKIVAWPSEWQDRVQDWYIYIRIYAYTHIYIYTRSSPERTINRRMSLHLRAILHGAPAFVNVELFWACSRVSEDTARRVSTAPWIWHDLTESQLLQAVLSQTERMKLMKPGNFYPFWQRWQNCLVEVWGLVINWSHMPSRKSALWGHRWSKYLLKNIMQRI